MRRQASTLETGQALSHTPQVVSHQPALFFSMASLSMPDPISFMTQFKCFIPLYDNEEHSLYEPQLRAFSYLFIRIDNPTVLPVTSNLTLFKD